MAPPPSDPFPTPGPTEQSASSAQSMSSKVHGLSDFVPVGYLSFNRLGVILEVNRAGASFWGVPPELLVQKNLSQLVAPDYEVPLSGFLNQIFDTGLKHTCEVKLVYNGKPLRFAQIVGVANEDYLGEGQKCFAALIDISERKRVEETLQLTEFSVNHAVDLVYWIDPSGKMSYINDAACKTLGFSREEIQSVTAQQICQDFPREDWDKHWDKLRQVGLFSAKSHYRAKNGNLFPVEHTLNYLNYNDKEYLVVFARDISQQSIVEEALRDSEERYRSLFESISDYVYTVRVDNGHAVSTSHGPGCIQVTGYSPQDYRDDPNLWYRMIYEKDRPAVLEQAASACTGRPTTPLEHRITHKDGSIRWIRNTPVIRTDEAGHVSYYEGIIVDITERKLAAVKLEDEERFLSDIFTSVQDGISVLDHEYKILRVNPTMEKWYAHNMPLIGKKCFEAYHGRSEPCKICPTRHTLSTRTAGHETVPLKQDGGVVTGCLEVYSYPFMDQSTGEMRGVIEYVRDITEKRMAEIELARSNQELTEANANLERMQRERDEFLAMISHDLRTPLVTGLGYIDMLVNGKFGEISSEAQTGMKVALKNLNRLQTLIGDILNFQTLSMQNAKRPLTMTAIRLKQLFSECASELLIRTGRKASTVSVKVPADLPAVEGNLEMIRRAITNLLNNTHRHAGPNAHIELSAQQTNQEELVEIAVSDNGPGIPEEIKGSVFDPFVKSGKSKEGSGLGLAIVRFIVNAHGAEPHLESKPGQGTRISFTLPPVQSGIETTQDSTSAVPSRPARIGQAKIMVVDDDTDTLEFVGLLLKKQGYQIVAVESAEKGWEAFQTETFHLALVDMTLTGMSGSELCIKIKGDARGKQLPVFMFTARADHSSRQKAQISGCDGYIIKPISIQEFLATIEAALNQG